MNKFLFSAVTAAALAFGVMPRQANASWLSEALHAYLDPGYGQYYEGPGYYPAYTYPYPEYNYTPAYRYYVSPEYASPEYGSPYYTTPYYTPYRPYWHTPRWHRGNRDWREHAEHERYEHRR